MEENLDLLDNGVATTAYTGKRPAFLTVLCILTFVGVGVSIVYNWYSLYQVNQLEKAFSLLGNSTFNTWGSDIDNSYKWLKISIVINLFGALLCLVSAIIMFNLRKFGYYIYIGGQIIPLVIAFFAASNNSFGLFGGLGYIWLLALMVFPVGFIIMYGLNFKYMK